MDTASATLLAALVGAVASLVTLWLTIRHRGKRAFRAAQESKLDSVVDELGDAIYQTVACSVLALRDRDARNRPYWTERVRESRSTLRRLRPKLRNRVVCRNWSQQNRRRILGYSPSDR
jgi:hypothetical protein